MNLRMIGVLAQLLCTASMTFAASSPVDKCASLQDAKKRLLCYDTASKQLPHDAAALAAKTEDTAPQSEAKMEAPPKADRSITIEAGLVYKSGDVKPVARTTFYLLDESLVEIFRRADIQPPLAVPEDSANYRDVVYPRLVLMSYGKIQPMVDKLADTAGGRKMRTFVQTASNAMAPHILAQGITDFSGRAKFESLKPGVYYLMGITQTQRGAAIWNIRVETKGLDTQITLDQNNAASAD